MQHPVRLRFETVDFRHQSSKPGNHAGDFPTASGFGVESLQTELRGKGFASR